MKTRHTDIRWPADRFYWARIPAQDAPRAIRTSSRRRQLEFILEPELPVPLDAVHVVFGVAADRSIIACAIDRDQLSLDPDVVSLGPSEVPAFIETDLDPASLNLLSGPFLARPIKQLGSRRALAFLLALILTTALVTLGMHRRATAATELKRQLDVATSIVYDQVLSGPPSSQPPDLRLLSERRLLEMTREAPRRELTDVVLAFESLVRHWPEGIEAQTQSLVLTGVDATLVVLVNSNEDAQWLADALDASPLWQSLQPQTRQSGDHVQLTLRLETAGGTR